MNTPPNAMPESLDSQVLAPATMSPTRPMYWSLRREFWENRSLYIAPLAVAGLVLAGFVIATIGRAVATVDSARRAAVLEEPYTFAMGVIMATAFIVGVFYSLEALHSERRDRSILFWKSLPVSDLTTVLAKASIPIVMLPLLSFVLVVVTQLIMGVLSSLVLLGSGLPVTPLWTTLFQSMLMLLYHLLTVHMLWYAPIYGWLLLVSGWARRATFLWAALPPLTIGVVEKIAFNTTHFAGWLLYRITGPEGFGRAGAHMTHPMAHDLGIFLGTPGLWMGLVVAALLLAAAVRLRRYREPI